MPQKAGSRIKSGVTKRKEATSAHHPKADLTARDDVDNPGDIPGICLWISC